MSKIPIMNPEILKENLGGMTEAYAKYLQKRTENFINEVKDDGEFLGEELFNAIIRKGVVDFLIREPLGADASAEAIAAREEELRKDEQAFQLIATANAEQNEAMKRVSDRTKGFLSSVGTGLLAITAKALLGA